MYNPLFKEVTDGYGIMADVIRIGVILRKVKNPENVRSRLLTVPRVTEVEYFEDGVVIQNEKDEPEKCPMFVITGERANYSLFMFGIEMKFPGARLAPSSEEHIYFVIQ